MEQKRRKFVYVRVRKNLVKGKVQDDVIAFFSKEENQPFAANYPYSASSLRVMNEYAEKWKNAGVTYDTDEGAEVLDLIIDECVNKVMEIENFLQKKGA